MSTSFGANSAVLLHLVATKLPGTPVLFVDPGDVPERNRAYAETLRKHLGFEVYTYEPYEALTSEDRARLGESESARQDVYARRKLEPMDRALREHGVRAIMHGIRADQNAYRATRAPLEPRADGIVRVYPLLAMTASAVGRYLAEHGLPLHPDGLPQGVRFECGLHL